MAQKAHPTSLRPPKDLYHGCTHWNEPRFYYITTTIHNLISSCCAETTHFLDDIKISRHLGLFFLEVSLIHFHFTSKKRFKSRRYKENKKNKKKPSWAVIAHRLYSAVKLIQRFTGTKKVILKVKRLKIYTRAVPKTARKQVSYYAKGFHRGKYDFARYGLQLIYLAIQGKASALSLSRFLEQNLCSRQKRKRHHQFLAFVKQSFQALQRRSKVQGIKIQIKGRFTHKAKGRSRVWKYQMGQMRLSQLDKDIQAEYVSTQTAYGSVGIKVWICN
uniref:ribosomal protein S3 n=1 Tax=Scytothamnus australis TaxID=66621 RepID=UPI002E76B0E0|nr:ribosomal protein S3 [Scytothamnus australis]WBP70300.1 ribosomal protein S3 [Scytothamnus australis]